MAEVFVLPSVFSARHVYSVASSGEVFNIISVLVWFCSPIGVDTMVYLEDCVMGSKDPLTTLSHVMLGLGRPLAEQENEAVDGCTTVWV